MDRDLFLSQVKGIDEESSDEGTGVMVRPARF
jgi:hypothetical protein